MWGKKLFIVKKRFRTIRGGRYRLARAMGERPDNDDAFHYLGLNKNRIGETNKTDGADEKGGPASNQTCACYRANRRRVCILEIWGPLRAFMRRGGADDDSLDQTFKVSLNDTIFIYK